MMNAWARHFALYVKPRTKVSKYLCTDENRIQAFVKQEFSNWKKAAEKFKIHEDSDNHRKAAAAIASRKIGSVSQIILHQSQQNRIDARYCLVKIFENEILSILARDRLDKIVLRISKNPFFEERATF